VILGSVMRRNTDSSSDADRRGDDARGGGSGGSGSSGGSGGGSGYGRGPDDGTSGGSGSGNTGGRPRTIIIGCGRVGATLAGRLSAAGQEVTIIDTSTDAFNRLPDDFSGQAVRGDGTDEDVLRRAGAEGADQLFAMTEGDNRNVLTAQLAAETLGVRNVVAKVNDPVRAEAYAALGIATICRTSMAVEALATYIGLPGDGSSMGVIRPTGHHDGDHGNHGDPSGSPAASLP
jgi:trk system potassium uptake protein TrkA